MTSSKGRCGWAVEHPELLDYHDNVWGQPTHDDREIFAAYGQCVLHAGLLWTAMLMKRPIFAAAFENWDVAKIVGYDEHDIDRLMHTAGMMRDFQKITCIIKNAARYQEVQREYGTFAAYVWQFVEEKPLLQNASRSVGRREADQLSVDLKNAALSLRGRPPPMG
ncbi:DNA-3-methyladenine glycosylase I [Candidatus Saccharibacteria bacterium]|nr:DNA-3-methyladenine glycosylase I [Candidatus Saccharibacteria bacterium]